MVTSLDQQYEISALFGRLGKRIIPTTIVLPKNERMVAWKNKSEWGQCLGLFISSVVRQRTVTKVYPFKVGFLSLTKLLGILAVKAWNEEPPCCLTRLRKCNMLSFLLTFSTRKKIICTEAVLGWLWSAKTS